ncbi:zinc finger protein 541-like [Willisornis vidua]|uniref:Zinc finger protein 541-like n=1 Tax=Willisornis vidua TaxID=1566151 RepID=A0ABQ9DKJ2_9PASS|nr:zinc finger protein 541-like [Willisornis vidua]
MATTRCAPPQPSALRSPGMGRDRRTGMEGDVDVPGWHINVGSDFQAEIPELQARPATEDEEPASLVWKPWEDTDSDMETHDRVRDLLDMASSSGIPGAAANLDLALHCLHQAQGSVPEALKMLLSGGPQTPQGHPLADYYYAGSSRWTPEEKKSFQKAFHTSGKNFHLIQKEIQSKTVAQCVEYYYSWKKEHKIITTPAQLILDPISKHVEDKKVIRSSQHGFTRGKSCLVNLISFYNETITWTDEGKAVDIAYLGFSKAFDTVQ